MLLNTQSRHQSRVADATEHATAQKIVLDVLRSAEMTSVFR